jgi:ribulose-phosphate 3-epimerase
MDKLSFLNKEFFIFLYKKKFLILYTLIGFTSILLELFLRSLLISFEQNQYIYNYLPLILGILYAFYLNIRINFSVPKIYLKKSLLYFLIISLLSFFMQKLLQNSSILSEYDYNLKRIFSSGLLFLIGYFLHITLTFKKSIKVGVAIYANGYDELEIIKNKIGQFPDFIHVDVVDESMKKNSEEIDYSKLNEIQKIWPDKEIHTHIMSKKPLYIIDKVMKFSKIIYIHNEVDEDLNFLKEHMIKNKVVPGLVLHAKLNYPNLEEVIKGFKEVMILSIDNPGYSGQQLNKNTFNLIKEIDEIENRKNFSLLVDGGVNSKVIKKINCDKIVSGAAVLKSNNPIIEIMKLQTVSRYEI